MRTLVVGSGGREHALAWRLSHESVVHAAPGNPGIAADGIVCHPVDPLDGAALLTLVQREAIELVVFGPEEPLVRGVADHLRSHGVLVYGPNAVGAQLEASKAFSKEIMAACGVPTAGFGAFTDPDRATEFARTRFDAGRAVAVKASGNALGKGVVVCDTVEEAEGAIRRMMINREFGEAGATVVVEDRLRGFEFSLLTIVGDENFVSLPVAQDHKRVGIGDTGPNTGGMGTFTPVTRVPDTLVSRTEETVVAPLLAELRRRGIPYRGTLFSGLMMDGDMAHCLEYNVRFGDPETQSVMMRTGAGFADALLAAASGGRVEKPEISPEAAVCVVVASGGYPGPYRKGLPIEIGPLPEGAKLFHAGTAIDGEALVTSGGRVIGATAAGPTLAAAADRAHAAAAAVTFAGSFVRSDIGRE